jgi:hypothetical protein
MEIYFSKVLEFSVEVGCLPYYWKIPYLPQHHFFLRRSVAFFPTIEENSNPSLTSSGNIFKEKFLLIYYN